METPKSNAGAKKRISNPDSFWARYLEYKAYTNQNPILVHDFVGKDGKPVHKEKQRPLLVEGFEEYVCNYYNIETIQQYMENREGRYSEFVSVISRIRKDIRRDQLEGGLAGIYHPNLTARINGVSDKVEQTVEQNVKLLNIDPLELPG